MKCKRPSECFLCFTTSHHVNCCSDVPDCDSVACVSVCVCECACVRSPKSASVSPALNRKVFEGSATLYRHGYLLQH